MDSNRKYNPSFDHSRGNSFIRKSNTNNEEDEEIKFPITAMPDRGENDFSIDFENVFDRGTKLGQKEGNKFGIDQCMLYLNGPITMHFESPVKLPTENIDEPSKVAITKIACGWDHIIVLLENGNILVGGNNTQGQLGIDPLIEPCVKDELYFHKEINEKYEVIDIGCGSNHTVLIVHDKHDENSSRKIFT